MRKTVKKKKKAAAPPKPVQLVHYTEQYFLNPQHPITVKVIGCGGSGSQMLQALARINVSLLALGHPGLLVQAWDADKVTEANLGRQLFSKADLDQFKAKILIERINRFYGFNWQATPLMYDEQAVKDRLFSNVIITCVDNVTTRELVQGLTKEHIGGYPFNVPAYWLDLGNTQNTGQVVLGTFGDIAQPKRTRNTVKKLPTILDLYPDMRKHEKPGAPSCSLAEALDKQDLFINSTLVQFAATILWKMFRELNIRYHGCYLNLENMSVNPIKVK